MTTAIDYSNQHHLHTDLVGRNVRDEYKTMPTDAIKADCDANALPFAMACLSLTGDLNVGSILRSAHLFGAKEAFVIGRRVIDRRSMVGVQNYLTFHRIEGREGEGDDQHIDPEVVHDVFVQNKLIPIVCETSGTPLPRMDWPHHLNPIIKSGYTPTLVVGNEGIGIDQTVMDVLLSLPMAVCISIPQRGALRSHNVANAAAIVMTHMVNGMDWWQEN